VATGDIAFVLVVAALVLAWFGSERSSEARFEDG